MSRNRNSQKEKVGFTVQLEPGVWLADGVSALDRTLVLSNAAIYDSQKLAQHALNRAIELRPLPNARIEILNRDANFCLRENEPCTQSDSQTLPTPG